MARPLNSWWIKSGLGGPSAQLMERLPRVVLSVLGYCFAFALPAVIVSAMYFRNPVSWMISWLVEENFLCDAPTQGIGVHCFGDFHSVRLTLEQPSPWDNRLGGTPYLPLALWPVALALELTELGLGMQGALIVFLIAVVAAAMTPAIWAAWKLRHRFPTGVVVCLAGGMTWPVFSLFDRGNVTAFIVPLLLVFIITLRQGPAWVAPTALVAIVMIRPQFLAIGALLLVVGRWRHLIYAVEGAIVAVPLSFIVWDSSNWVSNLRSWFDATSGWENFQSLQSNLPTNLAASRSLYRASGILNVLQDGFGDSVAEFVMNNARNIGILILLSTIAILFVGRSAVPLAPALVMILGASIIFSSPTYMYYLSVGLLVAAVLLVPDSLHHGPGDRLSFFPRRLRTLWLSVTLLTVVISLVPIPFALERGRQSIGLEAAGPIWLLAWLVSAIVILTDFTAERTMPEIPDRTTQDSV